MAKAKPVTAKEAKYEPPSMSEYVEKQIGLLRSEMDAKIKANERLYGDLISQLGLEGKTQPRTLSELLLDKVISPIMDEAEKIIGGDFLNGGTHELAYVPMVMATRKLPGGGMVADMHCVEEYKAGVDEDGNPVMGWRVSRTNSPDIQSFENAHDAWGAGLDAADMHQQRSHTVSAFPILLVTLIPTEEETPPAPDA